MHFAVFSTKPLLYSHAHLTYVFPLSSPSEYLSVLFIHYGSVHCTLLITKAFFVLHNRSIPTSNRTSLYNLYAIVLSDIVDGFWPCGSVADRLWLCFCKCMMVMFPVISPILGSIIGKCSAWTTSILPQFPCSSFSIGLSTLIAFFHLPVGKKAVVVLMIHASGLVASSRWSTKSTFSPTSW